MLVPEITFYRQVREDGGVRTGVTVDGTTIFERYESSGDDYDPALTWYVDVRCESAKASRIPERVRQFLLKHAKVIREGLAALAEKFEVGMDFEYIPVKWPIPGAPKGVRMAVVCSICRRSVGLDMGKILNDVAEHWEEWVQELPYPLEEVSS
jgi:hypothetical protein